MKTILLLALLFTAGKSQAQYRTETIRVAILYADTSHRKEQGLRLDYHDTHWCFGWQIRDYFQGQDKNSYYVEPKGYLDVDFKKFNKDFLVFTSVPAHQ